MIATKLGTEKGFKRLTELSYVKHQLLLWRCGLDINNLDDMTSPDNKVCFYHYCKYISCYKSKQKSCSNPFNIHIKTKKKTISARSVCNNIKGC